MLTPALSTFSTQRYDHRLKHQLSSISDFFTTDATLDSSALPSTIVPEALHRMVQGPPIEGHGHLRPPSSRSSSNHASSRWHEGHSGRVSTLSQIDSTGALSSNTSVTSFHLSAGGCEQSLLMAKQLECEQLLTESSLSTSQVEAHVPAPSTECLSEGINGENEGDDIQEQVHLVSLLPIQADTVCYPTSAIRARPRTRNINTLSSPLCLHQYCHPEYDSDDMNSWSDPSISHLSSASAASEVESSGRDSLVEDVATTSSFSDPLTPSKNLTSLRPAIPSPLSPTMRSRGPNSGTALAIDLADIGEEELIVGEAAPQRASHAAGQNSDDLASQVAPPRPTESRAWWKFYPKDRRTTWTSSCFEQTGRHQDPALGTRLELGEPVVARPSPGAPNSGSKEPKPSALPLSHPLSPVSTTRPSSGTRKFLSVVLPCIPTFTDTSENKIVEKTNNNAGSNADSWVNLIPAFSFGPWRKKNRQAPTQEEKERGPTVTGQTSGGLLGVRIDQQVSRVGDH